ncbi:MAG: AMIN domain-containing protein, partial [Glaciimonas sp.]|nr:AMIN domain-containing protein [Glaciimonas sp.]
MGAAIMLASSSFAAMATNAITSISANQQGANVIITVNLKEPLTALPKGFAVVSPARIALDFPDVENATGKASQDLSLGEVRNVMVAQSEGRTRLVLNLKKPLNYAMTLEGKALIVTVDGSGGVATAVQSNGLPAQTATISNTVSNTAPSKAPATAALAGALAQFPPRPVQYETTPAAMQDGKPALRDIDFRRGTAGEGRVVIDLPSKQVVTDVRQQGQTIVVDFIKTSLPASLRRRLDVGDFGTPVRTITTVTNGENVRMIIEPKGLWEHSAFQSYSQLVIQVKPLIESANKLGQGVQHYRGDKLSLNFQSVEVRAILQVIADFTGLNIITSDTVSGSLTLRLKDVPWDQALDIVLQSKGLDMRKNGSVIWIAPKDELLTKEKLEMEQKCNFS